MKPTPLELAAAQCVAGMASIPFFPPDEITRAEIMRGLVEMANTPEELRELSRRMRRHYRKWPSEAEMRGVFCTFAKPKDGWEEGVTNAGTLASHIENGLVEAHSERKHLAAGGEIMKRLAEAKRL